MTKYKDPVKLQLSYKIDLESIKPYYNLAEKSIKPIEKFNRYLNVDYDVSIFGYDYEFYHLTSNFFMPKRKDEYTEEEKKILYDMIEESFAIAYLFCENEWNTYYKYIYNSYQVDIKKFRKKENYIAKELIALEDIIKLFKMFENVDSSDARLRLKDKYGNVDKNSIIELNSEERLFAVKALLERRLISWESKQLTIKDIEILKKNKGKQLLYDENQPIVSILKKMNNITSQGIMYLNDVHNKSSSTDLSYLTELYQCIKDNWSWDERASPLNTFNSLIAKTLNQYLDDKITLHEDIFKKGLNKHKLQAIFSVLRILNLIPDKESLDVSKTFDAKEDYIKDLLKK